MKLLLWLIWLGATGMVLGAALHLKWWRETDAELRGRALLEDELLEHATAPPLSHLSDHLPEQPQ